MPTSCSQNQQGIKPFHHIKRVQRITKYPTYIPALARSSSTLPLERGAFPSVTSKRFTSFMISGLVCATVRLCSATRVFHLLSAFTRLALSSALSSSSIPIRGSRDSILVANLASTSFSSFRSSRFSAASDSTRFVSSATDCFNVSVISAVEASVTPIPSMRSMRWIFSRRISCAHSREAGL